MTGVLSIEDRRTIYNATKAYIEGQELPFVHVDVQRTVGAASNTQLGFIVPNGDMLRFTVPGWAAIPVELGTSFNPQGMLIMAAELIYGAGATAAVTSATQGTAVEAYEPTRTIAARILARLLLLHRDEPAVTTAMLQTLGTMVASYNGDLDTGFVDDVQALSSRFEDDDAADLLSEIESYLE